MWQSHLLSAGILLVCAHSTAAQTPSSAPPDVVRLVGGSVLVGRVNSTEDGKIYMFANGLGDVVIDSAAVESRTSSPTPQPPSSWSGMVSGSVTHISTAVPDVAGSTLGGQMTFAVARTGARDALTLDGHRSYWHVEPDDADVDDWGLTLGGRRMLAPRWVLLGRSTYEVNLVQYLKYRSSTIAGLGYYVVQSDRVSLLFAPGFGYGASEQTALGRVLSFAAGTPPNVEGPITGVYSLMTLQLTPALSFRQDIHYFYGLGHTSYRQAQSNAQLLDMMTKHFGLSITFKGQYDSSMPPPVNRTLWSLNTGVQLKF